MKSSRKSRTTRGLQECGRNRAGVSELVHKMILLDGSSRCQKSSRLVATLLKTKQSYQCAHLHCRACVSAHDRNITVWFQGFCVHRRNFINTQINSSGPITKNKMVPVLEITPKQPSLYDPSHVEKRREPRRERVETPTQKSK